jgi:hypothetical protein
MLGFDRASAYERPYPLVATSAFTDAVILGQKVGLHESRLRNLSKVRGRVQRIAIRTEGGRRVNLLAISREPPERLVEILFAELEYWLEYQYWAPPRWFVRGNTSTGGALFASAGEYSQWSWARFPPPATSPRSPRGFRAAQRGGARVNRPAAKTGSAAHHRSSTS